MDGKVIETVKETKLLGTLLTDKLNWNRNTEKIVKESNKRMVFLHKTSKFTCNKSDLKKIYIQQIRSKLEQSAVVWHSSLSQKCKDQLERVQNSAGNENEPYASKVMYWAKRQHIWNMELLLTQINDLTLVSWSGKPLTHITVTRARCF